MRSRSIKHGANKKGLRTLFKKAWPWLSYMCHTRSTAATRLGEGLGLAARPYGGVHRKRASI